MFCQPELTFGGHDAPRLEFIVVGECDRLRLSVTRVSSSVRNKPVYYVQPLHGSAQCLSHDHTHAHVARSLEKYGVLRQQSTAGDVNDTLAEQVNLSSALKRLIFCRLLVRLQSFDQNG